MLASIRNYTIVGHIDHGKTTLTDRLLELTETIPDREMRALFMDQMELERERGITIKAKTVRMTYQAGDQSWILNLIDTPGHVDFSYEVNRALTACEGAVLIVDATQGIQAQTVAHFSRCTELGIKMIPVVNKIDLANALVEETTSSIVDTFGFKKEEIITLSAKTGQGVDKLLEAIVGRMPPPKGDPASELKALVFDSSYDPHRGVVAVVRVFDGRLLPGEPIFLLGSQTETKLLELGYFTAGRTQSSSLSAGEVGYLVTDLKEIQKCRVGETITSGKKSKSKVRVEALPGYRPPQPVVFADFYPLDQGVFFKLNEALNRLALTDASLQFKQIDSPSLGRGFRCGFLGLLHLDIIAERLRREFELELLVTEPRVEFRLQQESGLTEIKKPGDLPFERGEVEEPVVKLSIYCPESYLGVVTKLGEERNGVFLNLHQLGSRTKPGQTVIIYKMALRELISGFYDELKSASSGYASFEYEPMAWQPLKVVKLKILLNHQEIEALTKIIPEDQVQLEARRLVKRLREVIPKHQFAVPIQAVVGRKVIARETVPALRKDVTAPLYGGDVTRKRKLLEKQKRGKKRLKAFGQVNLPPEVFRDVPSTP